MSRGKRLDVGVLLRGTFDYRRVTRSRRGRLPAFDGGPWAGSRRRPRSVWHQGCRKGLWVFCLVHGGGHGAGAIFHVGPQNCWKMREGQCLEEVERCSVRQYVAQQRNRFLIHTRSEGVPPSYSSTVQPWPVADWHASIFHFEAPFLGRGEVSTAAQCPGPEPALPDEPSDLAVPLEHGKPRVRFPNAVLCKHTA